MLEKQIKGFLAYCKVAGFKERSIETLSLRLNEFNKFLKSNRFSRIRSVNYAQLSAFVADYRSPSVQVKKARIRTLRQSFPYFSVFRYFLRVVSANKSPPAL